MALPAKKSREDEIEEALKEEFEGSKKDSDMGFFTRMKKSMFHPSEFFEAIKSEEGIGKPLKFVAIMAFIFTAIFSVLLFMIGFILLQLFLLIPGFSGLGSLLTALGTLMIILIGAFIWIFFIAMTFVGAGIMHVFVKIVGGKGDFTATYKAYAYSLSVLIFMWIPFVNIIFAFLEIYMVIVGLSKLHSISKKRALLALILPAVIVLIILLFLLPSLFHVSFSSATDLTEQQLQQQTGQLGQSLRIENVQGTTVFIRNIGTASVPTSSVSFYVNNIITSCTQWISGVNTITSIEPSSIASCALTSPCSTGQQLKLTTPGFSDTTSCS